MGKWIVNLAGYLSSRAGLLSTIALALMALSILADMFARSFLNRALMGSIDTVKLCMIVVVFTSFANTQLHKGHIRVQILSERLPERVRAILESCILLLVLCFTSLMIWQASIEALHAWCINEFSFGFVRYPTWPAKMFMPLGLLVLEFQLFADVLASFKRLNLDEQV